MKKFVKVVDKLLVNTLVSLLALMVLTVSWQVFSRYILNDPSSLTEEIARFLLVIISLLGASYAYRTRMHLGLDLLVDKLPSQYQILVSKLVLIICAIFSVCVLLIGGAHFAWLAWSLQQYSAALNISMVWIYSVLPITGCLFTYYTVYFFFNYDDYTQVNKLEAIEVIK